MFHVYVLQSETSGKMYIGYTNNLDRRLSEHNDRQTFRSKHFTFKNAGPWKLIYKEQASDKKTALIREKQLKSHQGRDFIKNLIWGGSSMVE